MLKSLFTNSNINRCLETRLLKLSTFYCYSIAVLLSLATITQAATTTQDEIKAIQTAIETQQTAILDEQNQLKALRTDSSQYSNKIIRARMSIKQLELDIKRQNMHLNEDANNTTAKAALRTASYKQQVAEIELNKLKAQENNTIEVIKQMTTDNQAHEEKLFALSEQLDTLQTQLAQEKAIKAAAAAKKRKKKALAKKQQTKKKIRKPSAKPKVLSASEKVALERRQNILRQQASLSSTSLANSMLLNTQAIALVPITGTPNLGVAPMLKQRIGIQDKYKSVGYFKHLGNSQYIFEIKLESGKNSFRVEEFEYRKQVAGQDSGKQALLLIDARNTRNPEFTLIKKQ